MLGLFALVFLFPGEASALSSYWKNYFSIEERKAVQKNAEKYTISQIESKSNKWKGIIRGYNIKNGSISDDDIEEDGITTNKIRGLRDYVNEKISDSSTPQDFSADNLTGTYAALNGSQITNLNSSNLNGTVDLAHGGTGAISASGARTNLGLEYANVVEANFNISIWGDSLTIGYAPQLFSLVPKFTVYNGGIGGEGSTDIKDRMLDATDKYNDIAVIWAGNNNATNLSSVKADIAEMVDALTSPKRFVILSLDISTDYPEGNQIHTNIVNLNNELATIYPDNYIDIRSYLVSQYDDSVPQDVTDHDNDLVPSSLRSDSIHLNADGYAIVAQKIADFILEKYYPSNNKIISYSNLPDIMSSLPPVGTINLKAGEFLKYNDTIFSQASTELGNFFTAGAGSSSSSMLGTNTVINSATGTKNTGTGYGALSALTSGESNTANGYLSLYKNTEGSNNTSVGYASLLENTTGNYNTAMGRFALNRNTTGIGNVAVGFNSSLLNTTGTNNVAVGYEALKNNISGSNNVAVGQGALLANTTGPYNIAIGNLPLQSNTTGLSNIAHGTKSLFSNTTGNYNIATGWFAGYGDGTTVDQRSSIDDYMTFIGFQSSRDASIPTSTKLTKSVAIGVNARVGCSSCMALGGTGTNALNVGIGTTTPVATLDVNGQVRIQKSSAQPFACDATHDGTIALTSGYRTCVCKGGSTTWVFTTDGTTSCTW